MKSKKQFLLATITALFFVSQAMAQEPVKVNTKGLAAKIKFESALSGFLSELNGKYKLRVCRIKPLSMVRAIISLSQGTSIIPLTTKPMRLWSICSSKFSLSICKDHH
jgi:hypothetical protein